MSTKKKHPGVQFKKGNPGGPGRPKTPEHIRKAAKIGRIEFQAILQKFSTMDYNEFKDFMTTNKMSVMERIVGSIMIKAMKGDTGSANLIWDRMVGKVKEEPQEVNVSVSLASMPRAEAIQAGKEAVKFLEAADKGEVIEGEVVDEK